MITLDASVLIALFDSRIATFDARLAGAARGLGMRVLPESVSAA